MIVFINNCLLRYDKTMFQKTAIVCGSYHVVYVVLNNETDMEDKRNQ